ncbi:MAG: VCBS repeat-containing protein [Planctomycetes bacterium]|nr:VCBS repeat-containing protein [Planctomycetota bacterium]
MRIDSLASLLSCGLFFGASSPAQTFDSPTSVAFAVTDGTFAKLDGDAWRELVGLRGTKLITVRGSENGFLIPIEIDLALTGRLVVADLDGDSHLDAFVAGDPAGACRVALGQGNAGFAPRAPFAGSAPVAGARNDVWVFDHGGDGDLDVIQYQSLYENDGTASFTVRPIGAIASGGVYGMADVDGNGELDLLSRERFSPERSWVSLSVGGTFSTPMVLTYPGVATLGPSFVDVDGDGWIDVVSSGDRGVAFHYGRSMGGFDPVQLQVVAVVDGPLAAGDFDGNGWTDLAMASSSGATQVLYQLALRTFAALPAYSATASQAGGLRVIDLDDDGILDLVGFAADELVFARGKVGFGFDLERIVLPSAIDSLLLDDLDRDGDLDLFAASANGVAGGISYEVRNRTDPAFVHVGVGTPGSSGLAPRVQAVGGLPRIGNTSFGVLFDKLDPGLLAILVGATQGGSLPFGPGSLYVLPPFAFLSTTTTGGQFGFPASGRLPLGLSIDPWVTLPQPDLYLQLVVLDIARNTTTLSPGIRIRIVE